MKMGNDQPADKGLPFTVSNEGTAKTTPPPEGPHGDKDSEGLKPLDDMEPLTNPVADLTSTESDEEEVFVVREDMDEDTQADKEVQSPSPNTDKLESSHVQDTDESTFDSSPELKKYDNILPLTERQLVKYPRKVSRVFFNRITQEQWTRHEEAVVFIEAYYEENIDHKEQTDKVIDTAMNSLDKNNIARGDLLNALNRVTEKLKTIRDAVKEDLVLNKKFLEATKAYTKNSTHLIELLKLVKNFDFQGLKSSVMTTVESSKAEIRSELFSLKQDTTKIKSIMTKIFQGFKGENVTQADTKEPPSQTEGEHDTMKDAVKKVKSDKAEEEPIRAVLISVVRPPLTDPIREVPVPQREGKSIATDEQLESTKKLVPASKVI
ncbi:hypothetical protein Tco_0988484 [Tanacetum coccineum]|uniref:Uncharacterized protein n=1 Tax=Tanacetum coccineum TaxID=301880 RepID=A0ABQ5ES11_9ASTR